MAAYEFTGPNPVTYHYGEAKPGDIAYYPGRAPDGNWTQIVAVVPAPAPDPEPAPTGSDAPARPNKAAPAADWVAYAKAEGSFPGNPEEATRKAIVDHYSTADLTMKAGIEQEPGQ